jgi:tellurite resistance protein TehA-like permease
VGGSVTTKLDLISFALFVIGIVNGYEAYLHMPNVLRASIDVLFAVIGLGAASSILFVRLRGPAQQQAGNVLKSAPSSSSPIFSWIAAALGVICGLALIVSWIYK